MAEMGGIVHRGLVVAIGCLSMLVAACGSDSADPAPATEAAGPQVGRMLPSDAVIMTKVYEPAITLPDGFYVDPRHEAVTSSTIHHIKSNVLASADQTYELCTDDIAVALNWSEIDNAQRVTRGALVATEENDMYYEFVRMLDGLPDWVGYSRVFKCSYVDRSGSQFGALSGPAGRLTKQPFAVGDVRRLSEYLWGFSQYRNYGNVVLQSESFADSGRVGHTLTLATLRRGAGSVDGCDVVDVVDWELSAAMADGQMQSTLRTLFSFETRWNAGYPELCGGS